MTATSSTAQAKGLQEGYVQEQWGPWKSHGLLLQQAISELGWQDNAASLMKVFKQHSTAKEGYLNREEFTAIMKEYPCCNSSYHRVFFDLFDRNQDGLLNESDFLGGVLAVSPLTPHKLEAPSGQLRMQFIFLYYDANRNGRLEVDEVSLMIEHIQQLQGQTQSDATVDATALTSLYSGPFGFAAFFDSAQKRMLNGTSPLLRTQQDLLESRRQEEQGAQGKPILPQLQDAIQKPTYPSRQSSYGRQGPAAELSTQGSAPVGPPAEASGGSLSAYPGTSLVGGYPGTSLVGGRTADAQASNVSPGPSVFGSRQPEAPLPPVGPGASLLGPRPEVQSSHVNAGTSLFSGRPEAQAPHVSQQVRGRSLVQHSSQPPPPPPPPAHHAASHMTASMIQSQMGQGQARGLSFQPDPGYVGGVDPNSGGGAQALALRVVRRLMELSNGPRSDWRFGLQLVSTVEMFLLCDTVVQIFRAEDSLVDVPLPCRVYGDIHGQLLDLLEFFNAFSWPDKRRGDIFSMNYIFLGDFVDRGAYSCDVITLLFSLKILYPSRVFLVRGNHEDRLMNVNYGFHADCLRKFAQSGEEMWERVNDVFEFLPVAALVDNAILCIHGGIGDSIHRLEDLRGIPKPIQVVGEITPSTTPQERMILDALWSDPTDNDSVLGVQDSPRGKNTCRFGPDRVQDFNRRNGLKLIIRAHECVQHGYEYFAAGQLLTVFSATNYCNQYNNDGAMVVLVKDNRTGEVVEHAQVIKSGSVDTSHGWNEAQFREPSPMRRSLKDS